MEKFLEIQSSCPICHSRDLTTNLELRYWRENVLHFSDCAQCRATFANPMPSDELISQGNTALVRYYQKDKDFTQEFREARQAYLKGKILARRLRRWKKKGKFLEIGCYQGFFALGVKDHCDWEVETLEIAAPLAQFIRGSLGIPCHQGTLETVPLEKKYDFVACYDLIEHINRPRDFLVNLAKILNEGGRVEILTPNTIQDFAFNRRAYAAGWPPTIVLNHIMNFSPQALELALKQVGLKIHRWHCFGVRHVLKDFGFFGMGKPTPVKNNPSMQEFMVLPENSLLEQWTPQKIQELRTHPKVSWGYALLKEILPKLFRLRVPARLGIGHEIYCLAEK